MAALIDAITVKRKMYFEFENAPYYCLEAEVSTPTARGGQTLVRLKMRNLLTRAVFDKTFKASDKFKEPDLETVEASYLYSDGDGSYFLDQETFDTLTLREEMIGDALEFLVEGALVKLDKFNGNPIGLQLPDKVELSVTYTEPGAQGDTSGKVTKLGRLETGLEIKVPLYIQEGEKVVLTAGAHTQPDIGPRPWPQPGTLAHSDEQRRITRWVRRRRAMYRFHRSRAAR
jgi:elongation factor P